MAVSSPLGWQLILRLDDHRVIAPSAAARRALARAVAAVGRAFGVYAWCVADNHLHVAAFCTREQAAELARRLRVALHRRLHLGANFERSRLTAINDQSHARSLLLYVIGQSAHHGAAQDFAHEASCIHDLVGARTIAPWLPERVREWLPRVNRAQLLAPLGIDHFEELDGLDAEATCAAFALPSLAGRSAAVVAARRASAAVAASAPTSALAAALGVDERTAQRCLRFPPVAVDVRALRRQLGLRAALACPPPGVVRDGANVVYEC